MAALFSMPSAARIRRKVRRGLEHLLFRLDTTRYLFDRPTLDYQPLPWVGVHTAGVRGRGSISRWEDIATHLPNGKSRSALDVGCCYGFFSIKLAERGYNVIGVDLDPRHVRIARYATPAALRPTCNFLELEITPDNAATLGEVDCTLLLSVWHHWVQRFGLPVATELLAGTWRRTGELLAFESGEGEVAEEFNLPFTTDNARAWLSDYLAVTCPGSSVELLSEHAVGDYAHYKTRQAKRGLFLLRRGT